MLRFDHPLMMASMCLLATTATLSGDEPDLPGPAAETLLSREGWTASDYFSDARYQQCCTAILKGDATAVETQVSSGLDPNKAGKDGMTLLMWAYAADQIEVFEKLLKLGADPNQTMQIGLKSNAVHRRPRPGDCVTIVVFGAASKRWRTAVVKFGGDPNAINAITNSSLLMIAGGRSDFRTEVTQEILQHAGVRLNFQDEFGYTTVMNSVVASDYERAVVLIEAGASVDCYNCNHQQLIDIIARHWISRQHLWEEQPMFKKLWRDDTRHRPWFEKLVFLLSERGFDLQTAMLSAMRRGERIEGLPYYEWRRKQRGHLNIGCPGLSNATDE